MFIFVKDPHATDGSVVQWLRHMVLIHVTRVRFPAEPESFVLCFFLFELGETSRRRKAGGEDLKVLTWSRTVASSLDPSLCTGSP